MWSALVLAQDLRRGLRSLHFLSQHLTGMARSSAHPLGSQRNRPKQARFFGLTLYRGFRQKKCRKKVTTAASSAIQWLVGRSGASYLYIFTATCERLGRTYLVVDHETPVHG